jgi:hypothetical protein
MQEEWVGGGTGPHRASMQQHPVATSTTKGTVDPVAPGPQVRDYTTSLRWDGVSSTLPGLVGTRQMESENTKYPRTAVRVLEGGK